MSKSASLTNIPMHCIFSLDLLDSPDTVTHCVFINTLWTLSTRGTGLKCLISYLHNISYKVSIGNSLSEAHWIDCGFPQGSVLGDFIYTATLSTVIRQQNVMGHSYSDDTQIWAGSNKYTSSVQTTIPRLKKCISDVSARLNKKIRGSHNLLHQTTHI